MCSPLSAVGRGDGVGGDEWVVGASQQILKNNGLDKISIFRGGDFVSRGVAVFI